MRVHGARLSWRGASGGRLDSGWRRCHGREGEGQRCPGAQAQAFAMKRRYWFFGAALCTLAVAFALSHWIRWPTQYRVPESSVSALVFSPDGNTLALGGHPSVKLWDVASRTERAALAGHSKGVTCLAYN